jgi:lycopene beta-cyclase
MTERSCDVVIVGGGPAGSALAKDCRGLGLEVLIVDPRVDEPWRSTYGTWVDDLDDRDDTEDLKRTLRVSWPTVHVVGSRRHQLPRAYGFFDNERLRKHLRGVPEHRSTVQEVVRDREADGLVVRCLDGERIAARVVVDAGGSRSPLLARHRHRQGGVQSAFGVVTRNAPATYRECFTLMDWSVVHRDPSFLYTVDFGDGSVLLEETSLYRTKPIDAQTLETRLIGRIGGDVSREGVEHVEIPMGWGVPSFSRTVVGFGAAAGFVHPVTGYSVAASLRATHRVSTAIHRGIATGMSVEDRVQHVWDAVWPAELRRTRALHQYGLSSLERFNGHDLQVFFDTFFSLPTSDWSSYLRIDTPPRTIVRVMTKFYSRMPWSLRGKVMTANPWSLLGGR